MCPQLPYCIAPFMISLWSTCPWLRLSIKFETVNKQCFLWGGENYRHYRTSSLSVKSDHSAIATAEWSASWAHANMLNPNAIVICATARMVWIVFYVSFIYCLWCVIVTLLSRCLPMSVWWMCCILLYTVWLCVSRRSSAAVKSKTERNNFKFQSERQKKSIYGRICSDFLNKPNQMKLKYIHCAFRPQGGSPVLLKKVE